MFLTFFFLFVCFLWRFFVCLFFGFFYLFFFFLGGGVSLNVFHRRSYGTPPRSNWTQRSNCFSRESILVFLKKPIATHDFPGVWIHCPRPLWIRTCRVHTIYTEGIKFGRCTVPMSICMLLHSLIKFHIIF